MQVSLARSLTKIERMQKVISESTAEVGSADEKLHAIRTEFQDIDEKLNGNRARQEPGEKFNPIINDRLFSVARGVDRSTYGPTKTHRRMLEIANAEIDDLRNQMTATQTKLSALVKELIAAGAPWIEGEELPDR